MARAAARRRRSMLAFVLHAGAQGDPRSLVFLLLHDLGVVEEVLRALQVQFPSHLETTTEATPLPMRLVMARHSLMNLSMPSSRPGRPRDVAHDREGRGQGDEAAAGDGRRALGGEQEDRQDVELLGEGHVGVGGLGDEQAARVR